MDYLLLIGIVLIGLIMLFCCWRIGLTFFRFFCSVLLLVLLVFTVWLGWWNGIASGILTWITGTYFPSAETVGLVIAALIGGIWFLGTVIINLVVGSRLAAQGGKVF